MTAVTDNGHRPPDPARRNPTLAGRMIGAVVGPLVTPVVDKVDVDDVVSRIDLDHVLERVDLDAVLERVDLDAVIDRIDVDRLLDRIDVNRLVARMDVNRLVAEVDIDEILQRVDLNAVIERVDINAVVDRVDINEVVARVDTDAIVERTEFGALIARSTSSIFGTVLDAVRSCVVSADLVVQGVVDKVMRRSDPHDGRDPATPRTFLPWRRDLALQGTPAGAVSRILAFAFDWFLLGVLFVFGQRMFALGLEVITGREWIPSEHRLVAGLSFIIWAFLYFAVPLAVLGRTPGKGLLGSRVEMVNGAGLSWRRAALRTLVLPLSFLFFGLGLFLGLFRRDRRTLHDLIAGTHEVYAWDARGAHLRLLATRTENRKRSAPQIGAEVLQAGIGEDDSDGLAAVRPAEQPLGGVHVGASGEAGEDPLDAGQPAGGGDGVVVGDDQAAVDQTRIE
jgi:uncharacterized RDD family membrane protein YckC